MDSKLSYLSLIEKNIIGRFSYIANSLENMEVIWQTPNLLIINSNLPSDMFNIICCIGKVTNDEVESAINYFKSRNLPFAWWVGFNDECNDLKTLLTNNGLKANGEELIMSASVEKFAMPNLNHLLRISQVTNQKTLDDFVLVLSTLIPHEAECLAKFFNQASSLIFKAASPLKFYVGYINNEPVGTNSIYLEGEIAGIFDIIALPKYRNSGIGLGIGGAMTLNAVNEAAKTGAITCIGTATGRAKYLYEKLGAQKVREMWVFN